VSRKQRFSSKQDVKIEIQYRKKEISSFALARRYHCSSATIKNAIKRAGGKLRSLKEAMNTKFCRQLQRRNNPFWKRKNHPMDGKHHSPETIQKMKDANKGEKNPMFGKTGEKAPMFGKHLSEDAKQKIRGKREGTHHTEETKQKMREKKKGKKREPHLENTKQKIREKMIQYLQTHHGPYKDTKPELIMQNIFRKLHIPYEKQYRVGNHLADFHLLNTNKLIEVDGDWYHGNPKKFSKFNKMQLKQKERDKKHNKLAKKLGYIVLRFWENDILNNAEKVKEKIRIICKV